jgi:hypothetical protein
MNFSIYDYKDFKQFGKENHKAYLEENPFPSGYYDGFFNEDLLSQILDEFPDLDVVGDVKFVNANEKKLATKGEYKLGDKATEFIRFMNSQPVLEMLSELTGIEDLIPDPSLVGGGYHEIKPGGFLKVHADFNKHPVNKLDRRLNVLVYLNKDWEEEFGGFFELWNDDMTEAVTKILPLFNRMAMFSTTSNSYHGHPDKLTCPEGRSRKSIALYYYTNGRPEEEVNEFLADHSTIFKARQGKDSSEETEAYISRKLLKEKKNKKRTDQIQFIKSLVPPVLWDLIKK